MLLAEVTYTLRLRASDSRKIESAEESLSHWFTYTVRDSFKALLAGVLNLQKRTAAKALQMRRLSAFAFEAITLWNFEKKMNEANASVKRNTKNTIKQLMSKLAIKMQGKR